MPVPAVRINKTEKDAFKALNAHLKEEPLKKVREFLQQHIKDVNLQKTARRQKIKLTGKGKSQRVDLPKAQLPEGVPIPIEGPILPWRERARRPGAYDFNVKWDDEKQNYIISYYYGKAQVNGVFKGIKQEWVVSAKKKAIWKILDTDFARAVSPISYANFKPNVDKLASGIQEIDWSRRAILSYAALAGSIGMGVGMMGMFDQENAAGLKPEIIVGTVPVYSVQYIERAKSDRKLKSRAIGDVFLAHQKGNKDIVRIDLTLSGQWKYIYLWYFIALQRDGSAITQNVQETGLPTELSSSGSSNVTNKSQKILNYDVHKTFPIITKNHIMLSMYLQTIEWHQSVQDGKNVIKVHLLFRKYLPTGAYKIFNPVEKDGEIIAGSGLELVEKFGMAKRWMEFAVDGIWKMMRMHGEMYGRMMIGDDGQDVHLIDQEAVSSMDKMITSYSGKFLGIL